jgi:hypothetical protein
MCVYGGESKDCFFGHVRVGGDISWEWNSTGSCSVVTWCVTSLSHCPRLGTKSRRRDEDVVDKFKMFQHLDTWYLVTFGTLLGS